MSPYLVYIRITVTDFGEGKLPHVRYFSYIAILLIEKDFNIFFDSFDHEYNQIV